MESINLIPYLDLSGRDREIGSAIRKAIEEVISSGRFIGGEPVDSFEESFAGFIGTSQCVGVGNGLDALHMILQGLGIGHGHEVIVPAQTFVATWLAVSLSGAKPVPVDVLSDSGNLNPSLLSNALTPKTSAVIAVHLHGRPADMTDIKAFTDRHGLALIEDAAQAHGAMYMGKRIGSLGHAAAFSFYPTKNLGALGDAGCVTTQDEHLATRIRSLASYGSTSGDKYSHRDKGWNSRLDPVQAAALNVMLPHLDHWNQRRQSIATLYFRLLREVSGLSPLDPNLGVNSSVWHHFVVKTQSRDAWRDRFFKTGIETDIHYPIAPFEQEAYREEKLAASRSWNFPVAKSLSNSVFSLPVNPYDDRFEENLEQIWKNLK